MTRSTPRFAVRSLLFASLLSAPTLDLAAATLTGEVKTTEGTALPQIHIVVIGAGDRHHAVTGLGGRFSFDNLKPGEYRIETTTPGLVTVSPLTVRLGAADERINVVLGPAAVKEHVVVSATRTDAAASTLGLATTVIDGEEIESRRPITVVHLLQEVPGVAVSRTGAPGRQASVFVRGGESNFSRVMVDGIVLNAPGGAYDYGDLLALDLSRIEVVRGAGSSLYGSDALAGVVNLVTRGANGRSGVSAEAQGGSNDFWQGRAAIRGRSGAFDWRGALLHLRTDNDEPNGAFKETAGLGSVAIRLSESARIRGTLRISDSRAGTPGQTLFGRPDLDAYVERDDFVGGLSFEAHGDSVAHTVRFGISDTDQLSVNPLDSGPYVPSYRGRVAPFTFFDFPDPLGFENNTRRTTLGYQAEIQAAPAHLVTAGIEAERERGELGTPGDATRPSPERTNLGAYLQDRWALGTRAFLTLGARVERNDSYGTRLVPRVALAYRLQGGDSGTMLHASAGAGINEPSFFHTFGLPPFTRPNPDLKPERSRTFDVGLEQRLSKNARVDVTGFHHDYRDQIAFQTVSVAPFEGAFFNLGRSRGRGVEVSAEVAAARGLRLRGAYTYLDGRILESTSSDPVFAEGHSLLRRPKHQTSVFARFTRGRLDLGANLVHVGRRADSDFSALGLVANEAYTRVDASADFALHPRLRAFAAVENLLDKRYQEALGYPALGRSLRLGLMLRPRSEP